MPTSRAILSVAFAKHSQCISQHPAPVCVCAEAVDWFFQERYQSAAEPLPVPSLRCRAVTGDADLDGPHGNPWLQVGDMLCPVDDVSWRPDRPAVDLATMLTLAADGVDVGLPVRFLGHAALHSLYWCFCAHWAALHGQGALEELRPARGQGVKVCAGGSTCPSFSSFRRRWDEVAGVCTVIIG